MPWTCSTRGIITSATTYLRRSGMTQRNLSELFFMLCCNLRLDSTIFSTRGAMVELGEGVSKFGKLKLKKGPFYEFDKEMRAVLDFLYNTQLENAACNDDFCITMDGSQENYQLLGNFGAGEELYKLEKDVAGYGHSLIFSPTRFEQKNSSPSVKLPILLACEGDLNEL
ncbi:uncharacterized protein LOC9653176 [Selaginella moellendorffii]|uniref:uncharacterized protein LOC9653176 n=1 Tax=Selaginella moellendorffii TaxID=88036 RepID=UPI000D1CC7E3|nr:uncharacterized protein LOC9653176 [Selaginella moellendorffii]|eukprot:XP_024515200.1 uncharacterized protein LOC9653176 [Selaginella moellendorffii]